MTDSDGAPVADGTYTVRMELADRNSSVPSDNNQGAFAFVKDGQSGTDTTSGGGFDNVSIVYTVETTGGMCGDGVLDTGETCDPVDTCPTSCAPADDACIAVALTGSPANCDAECVETTISACVDDDGCCPDGCTDADDNDCDGGAGYSGDLQSTGCRVGGGGSPRRALVVALALLLALARRRRANWCGLPCGVATTTRAAVKPTAWPARSWSPAADRRRLR